MNVKAAAVRSMMKLLPFDPAQLWRELPQEARDAFRVLLELTVGANELGAPDPPLELLQQCEAAGVEFGVPSLLLVAVAWEMSRYGTAPSSADRAGLMGVPVALYDPALDQVRAVARALGALSSSMGTAAALARYAGRERAGAIAGTVALLAVRRIDATAVNVDEVRSMLALLEA